MAELLVFDLDGTLIDSRLDLANAVNYMRQSMNLEPIDNARVVRMIGNGINKAANIPLPDLGSADVMTTEYIPAPAIFLAAVLVESMDS